MAENLIVFNDYHEGSLEGILEGIPKHGAVLISHGAGGNMRTPMLAQTAVRLNELGFMTLRWNFGYTTAGRAPSAGGKKEIPEMSSAVDYLAKQCANKPVVLIGKSFGSRVATYLAPGRADISGFVFYGLPLQGAGKNAKPRDWSHMAKLQGKALFLTGEKDKLCPIERLVEVQKLLTIPFESEVVPGDHSFKPKGEEKALDFCVEWMKKTFAS